MSYFPTIPKLACLSMRVCVLNSVDTTMVSSLGCNLTCNRWYTKPPAEPPAGTITRKSEDTPGSLRDAPGGLGRFGTAQEEAYFMAKQKEELKKIKKDLKESPDLKQKK